MGKILLFYKYIDLMYPGQIKKWQRNLCDRLGLTGRIIIADEGINGTIGGSKEACEAYKKAMLTHPLFSDVDFKESEGGKDHFPRMRIVIKNEICRLGVDTKKVTTKDGGIHLKPSQVNELIKKKKDLLILDARNTYEWKIGTFENAICPDIENFREFPQYIDENLEQFKNKEVLMFCTGGVRCERASAYLRLKNVAKEVYQIQGGVHRYIEQYPHGYFKGKNYVFDGRVAVRANDEIIGKCDVCGTSCDNSINCVNVKCNDQFISCAECMKKLASTCSKKCYELVKNNKVAVRTIPKKIETEKKTST